MDKEKENVVTILPKHGDSRMETGVVQFGDDWPGIFIRGDEACTMAFYINEAFSMMELGETPDVISVSMLKNFANMLGSCNVGRIKDNSL